MALCFVNAPDGDDIVSYLGNHLRSHCDRIATLAIDDVSSRRCHNDTTTDIVAVIVTPLMLKKLKDSRNTGIKSVLECAAQTIFIYKACSSNDVRELSERVNSASRDKCVSVKNFEITDANHEQDYDTVELKLMGMIRSTKTNAVSRPSARKFLVDPETVTESQSSVETKIILLEEDKRYSQLTVQITGLVSARGHVTPTKLRDGIWAIKIQGLAPGKHTINVSGDGADLGTASVTCVTCCDALFAVLPEVVRRSPGRLLARLFKLNPDQLDEELIDFTSDGTESHTFFTCLNHILEKGGERQNCLHFCAKYNLPKTCKRIMERNYRPDMKDARDANGKTPLDIAKDMDFTNMKRILKPYRPTSLPKETGDNDDTGGLAQLDSPLGSSFTDTGGLAQLDSPLGSSFTDVRVQEPSLSSRLRKSSSLDEPDSTSSKPRLRKGSSTDEPEPTLTRTRKTSTASRGDATAIPEAASSNGKQHTAGLQRGAATLRTSRDSGNGSAGSGSRDTGTNDGSIQRRESSGRRGLASDGEHNTETMLFEHLNATAKTKQSFQFYQKAEHVYADVEDIKNARADEEATHHRGNNVKFRAERTERPYNQPWEQEGLPNGTMPEPERVITSL